MANVDIAKNSIADLKKTVEGLFSAKQPLMISTNSSKNLMFTTGFIDAVLNLANGDVKDIILEGFASVLNDTGVAVIEGGVTGPNVVNKAASDEESKPLIGQRLTIYADSLGSRNERWVFDAEGSDAFESEFRIFATNFDADSLNNFEEISNGHKFTINSIDDLTYDNARQQKDSSGVGSDISNLISINKATYGGFTGIHSIANLSISPSYIIKTISDAALKSKRIKNTENANNKYTKTILSWKNDNNNTENVLRDQKYYDTVDQGRRWPSFPNSAFGTPKNHLFNFLCKCGKRYFNAKATISFKDPPVLSTENGIAKIGIPSIAVDIEIDPDTPSTSKEDKKCTGDDKCTIDLLISDKNGGSDQGILPSGTTTDVDGTTTPTVSPPPALKSRGTQTASLKTSFSENKEFKNSSPSGKGAIIPLGLVATDSTGDIPLAGSSATNHLLEIRIAPEFTAASYNKPSSENGAETEVATNSTLSRKVNLKLCYVVKVTLECCKIPIIDFGSYLVTTSIVVEFLTDDLIDPIISVDINTKTFHTPSALN